MTLCIQIGKLPLAPRAVFEMLTNTGGPKIVFFKTAHPPPLIQSPTVFVLNVLTDLKWSLRTGPLRLREIC